MLRHRADRELEDRGASAVEFALVLPLLVMLLFGIVHFGFAYNAYVTVTHAAREGARMASVGQFDLAAVKADTVPLDQTKVSVTGPTLVSSQYYEVSVSYAYQIDIPFWRSQNLNITSTARMRRE
jgi:hypothetical protein